MNPLFLLTPRVEPLGREVTRNDIMDIHALFVQPSIDAGGWKTPELRSLNAILAEMWRALPENPEPRRYKPTLEPKDA